MPETTLRQHLGGHDAAAAGRIDVVNFARAARGDRVAC